MSSPVRITLDHGSGGLVSQELISGLFLKYLRCPQLRHLEDCALLEGFSGQLAFSTDSYVVDPLFFRVAISVNWQCMAPSTIWPCVELGPLP